MLLHLAELAGLGEVLQLVWGLVFRLRPLTAEERAASASVHPAGLIPHWQVRVDDGSYLITIGVLLARLQGLIPSFQTCGPAASDPVIDQFACLAATPITAASQVFVNGIWERFGPRRR